MSEMSYCAYDVVLYEPKPDIVGGLTAGVRLFHVVQSRYQEVLYNLRAEDEDARLAIDEFGGMSNEIEWDYETTMVEYSKRYPDLVFLVMEENLFDKTERVSSMFYRGRMSSAKALLIEPDDVMLFRKIFYPNTSPYNLLSALEDLR